MEHIESTEQEKLLTSVCLPLLEAGAAVTPALAPVCEALQRCCVPSERRTPLPPSFRTQLSRGVSALLRPAVLGLLLGPSWPYLGLRKVCSECGMTRECNFPGWECHGRLLVPICPVAWSLHEILTHFFSLSWTIEHTLGARRPLPTKSYFSSGKKKKKKVKQHCWFGVRPGGRSLGSLVDLDEGP